MSPFREVLNAFFEIFNSDSLAIPKNCTEMRGRDAHATAAGTAALRNPLFYREPPLLARREAVAACLDFAGAWFDALLRPIDEATRLCSSGVSWKI